MAGRPDPLAPPTTRSRLLRDPALYGVAAFALLVCGPVSRYLGSLADEGILLHGAVRLLRGEVIYRDFFEVVPPGGFLVMGAWMKLVGEDFGATRLLAVGTIALIAALAYAAATLAGGHRLLAALLAMASAIRAPLENNHHWLTTAASLAAAVSLLLEREEPSGRHGAAFVAGLFAGLAVTFTQTRGALLCVAVLALLLAAPGARSRLVSAAVGMAAGPAAIGLYLALAGALGSAAEDLVGFTSRRYAGVQYLPFGSFATWTDAATVAAFPAALLLTVAAVALRPHGAIWRNPGGRVALAFAAVGLLGAFPRPDVAHLAFTVPLAVPLVACALTSVAGRLPRPAGLALSTVAIGLCILAVGYATARRIEVVAEGLETIATPRGATVRRAAPWTTDYARLMAELDRLPAGDPLFSYPYLPMLAYLTGRLHPAAVDVMVPGYTTPEQFSRTCARVVREARWLVVDRTWGDPRRLRLLFPSMADPDPPEKRAFEQALALAFDHVVHRSPTFEVRGRGAAAPDTLCVSG